LGTSDDYISSLIVDGVSALESDRLGALLDYALQVNGNAAGVSDEQVQRLRDVGLSDLGIVQLTHLVSDFGSYNKLNLALQTDYDYREFWRELSAKKD
jgi:alkylhydroperoxidase family enzyme